MIYPTRAGLVPKRVCSLPLLPSLPSLPCFHAPLPPLFACSPFSCSLTHHHYSTTSEVIWTYPAAAVAAHDYYNVPTSEGDTGGGEYDWICEFCDRGFAEYGACEAHEVACASNPVVAMAAAESSLTFPETQAATWKQVADEATQTYYYLSSDEETQWELPEQDGWTTLTDEDTGNLYFSNE